jgi:hypothetical protein
MDNPDNLINYMLRIDQALGKYLQDENLRFVLMATEKKAAHFLKSSKHASRLIGTVNGNYDHLPSLEIGKMAGPGGAGETGRGTRSRTRPVAERRGAEPLRGGPPVGVAGGF